MRAAVAALALVCAAPIAAAAQDQRPAAEAENAAAAVQTSGPMVVQRLHTTFVVAPEAKYTRFDNKNLSMAGAYGGVLLDEQWLVGLGGYGLTSGGRDRGLWYFGGVFGWMPGGDRPVSVSARVLLGFGEATLTDSYTAVPVNYFPNMINPTTREPIAPPALRPITYTARYTENVFVAEPQIDAVFRVSSWAHVAAGVGYRAVDTYHRYGYYDPYSGYDGSGDPNHRLRGATASLSLQIGRF